MIEEAKKYKAVVRVAENFFRFPIDRFSKVVKESGYLGRIGRIFSYNDHTGYHNNSRWIAFADSHPLWVKSIKHAMDTKKFHSSPERCHENETFQSRYFMFPGDLMVIDQASNIKGFLGRHPRPGYTEWHGEVGTLIHKRMPEWKSETELRLSSREDSPWTDIVTPVIDECMEGQWIRTYSVTPAGTLEYINLLRNQEKSIHINREYYDSCIMGHIVDFTLAIRGLAESEFNEQDALMSLMMEVGVRESALRNVVNKLSKAVIQLI